jgi:hypothetical protein
MWWILMMKYITELTLNLHPQSAIFTSQFLGAIFRVQLYHRLIHGRILHLVKRYSKIKITFIDYCFNLSELCRDSLHQHLYKK